jgi:hypothetical protein
MIVRGIKRSQGNDCQGNNPNVALFHSPDRHSPDKEENSISSYLCALCVLLRQKSCWNCVIFSYSGTDFTDRELIRTTGFHPGNPWFSSLWLRLAALSSLRLLQLLLLGPDLWLTMALTLTLAHPMGWGNGHRQSWFEGWLSGQRSCGFSVRRRRILALPCPPQPRRRRMEERAG